PGVAFGRRAPRHALPGDGGDLSDAPGLEPLLARDLPAVRAPRRRDRRVLPGPEPLDGAHARILASALPDPRAPHEPRRAPGPDLRAEDAASLHEGAGAGDRVPVD